MKRLPIGLFKLNSIDCNHRNRLIFYICFPHQNFDFSILFLTTGLVLKLQDSYNGKKDVQKVDIPQDHQMRI